MQTYLNIAQIVVAIALIIIILLQVRGGGLGGIFGQPGTVYRTRRGVEKIMFQITIVLVSVFLVIAVLTLRLSL
ncbi:MAG: preprotein translocase subunit SecG [Dehalococcoidia bacterium]|jgi:preprotein translocase subunit SecG|nr:MAG: preprotein translocase subunit SecG [Dehalococcoidia bacterium]